MLEHTPALSPDRSRSATAIRVRRLLAVAAAGAAVVAFLVRLPAAFDNLDSRASFNARQSPIGRTIQGSDGLAIQNEFLTEALRLLPSHATYVVEQPGSEQIAAGYGISPTTLLALKGYVRFLLLPRRDVAPERAEYLLCYACDTDPYDKRGLKRLWSDPHGFVIGRLPT